MNEPQNQSQPTARDLLCAYLGEPLTGRASQAGLYLRLGDYERANCGNIDLMAGKYNREEELLFHAAQLASIGCRAQALPGADAASRRHNQETPFEQAVTIGCKSLDLPLLACPIPGTERQRTCSASSINRLRS